MSSTASMTAGLDLSQSPDNYSSPVEQLALISRAQWQDYQQRFQPLEDRLINSKMNFDTKNSLGAASQLASSAAATSAGEAQRNMGRYGLNMSPDVQAALAKDTALSNASAMADNMNRTRMALGDYQNTY